MRKNRGISTRALIAVLALTLLIGCSLGGTIAWLMDKTETVTNTFTVGDINIDLTETTIQANKRFFASEDDVPRQAYTMGIGTIMRCKKLIVVVSGKDKASILKQVIQGPVTPEVPGSILQFHPDCIIIADEDALSEMEF